MRATSSCGSLLSGSCGAAAFGEAFEAAREQESTQFPHFSTGQRHRPVPLPPVRAALSPGVALAAASGVEPPFLSCRRSGW